jgi:hypothetical protein
MKTKSGDEMMERGGVLIEPTAARVDFWRANPPRYDACISCTSQPAAQSPVQSITRLFDAACMQHPAPCTTLIPRAGWLWRAGFGWLALAGRLAGRLAGWLAS